MTRFRIAQVRVGQPKLYGPQVQPSAILKQPMDGPLWASVSGLLGDEPGDKKNHGGPEKAIHAYPVAHYLAWAAESPVLHKLFGTGSFGENLVVEGVTEADICLGDRHGFGHRPDRALGLLLGNAAQTV